MTATTLTTFVTNLGDVTISGVETLYDEPPTSLNTADLPAQWVQFPESEDERWTLQFSGGYPTLRAELVVAVEAVAQDRQSKNWSDLLTMMDAVNTALRGVSTGTLGKTTHVWTLRQDIVDVAGIDFWAAIATVEVAG